MLILVTALLLSAGAQAPASPPAGVLHVVVHDPSGAIIPGAAVEVRVSEDAAGGRSATSDAGGVAIVKDLPPGKYTVIVSFPGFAAKTVNDVRVRAGDTKRDVTLAIEKIAQSVSVGRDPATAASDPRSDRFSNLLTRDQIDALPDDPDELEQALLQMAGPGGSIRVDGFRGGKLPPKSQIRSIRFSSGLFAAENHAGGVTFIDILTQPGQGPLRGGADTLFRSGALDARNAFQTAKGPEQSQQYNVNLSGSLLRDRASFSFAAGAATLFDSANVFAALPSGNATASIRRPSDRSNFSVRLDDAITKTHMIRASYQENDNDLHMLGVGGFDLADHGYARSASDGLFRLSESGPLAKFWYAESRLQIHRSRSDATSNADLPTVSVLDAFTDGGAQQRGGRASTELEYATNVDYARKGHALRFGTLVDGGSFRSDSQTNYLGTYTFASLADLEAGRPELFSQRIGSPLVTYDDWEAGFYAQDDWRVRKNLTVSLGIRDELQTHLGPKWNVGPRAGLTWAPFRNGKTTIRAGAGLFYDWLDSDTYEQTLRVDGAHQQDEIVIDPGYPDPLTDAAGEQVLPSSRYQLAPGLVMPKRFNTTLGVTEQLAAALTLNLNYNHAEGWDRFRGRDVNAPIDGVRPDAAFGTITEVDSTARLRNDSFIVGLNYRLPGGRMFVFGNYTVLRQYNNSDGPFSLPANSYDLAAEWGRAAGVPHQTAAAVFSGSLAKALKLSLSITARSGAPYNITTGRDDNGDTSFTDRPDGVSRNSATAAGMWDAAGRLTYSFGFGRKAAAGGGGGGPITIVRGTGGGAGDLLGGVSAVSSAQDGRRFHLDLFVAVSNLFNRADLTGYSGVLSSPFFGQPTSAGPARKIDVGLRIGF